MMPRGECEGSESAGSTYLPRVDNYNVSFEQLLSSSFDSTSKLSSESDTTSQRPDLAPMVKEELLRCQNQVKHLTSLLRESESNCERLTQLSEALKEEIRRVERDQERKEHLQENSEYLKNVLLKFITLTGEDERLRLIPVFKTMLKLAPEEVTRLEVSVKENQQNRDNGNKGWSSYLQKWTT
jgi:DNA repair ATPase RecN